MDTSAEHSRESCSRDAKIKEKNIDDICKYRLIFNRNTRRFEKIIYYNSDELAEQIKND
jgi:hypothetical protein